MSLLLKIILQKGLSLQLFTNKNYLQEDIENAKLPQRVWFGLKLALFK
jgi:hypothetical protein